MIGTRFKCRFKSGRVMAIALFVAAALMPWPAGAADHVASASPQKRIPKGVAPRIGYSAPDFVLPDIHGRPMRLKDTRGRVVLLNFWATWCGPCRMEMPELQNLYHDLSGKSFMLVSVAGDVEGTSAVAPFINQYRITFPALIDSGGEVQDLYLVRSLPMTFLLDRNGTVVYHMIGYFDWSEPRFRGMIQKLLDEA